MHEILRERVWRRLEGLPPEQLYQVLDYIEFIESKYAKAQARQPDALQKFAERLEDGMRFRSVAPKVISGTVGLFGTARKVMQTVSDVAGTVVGAPADTTGRPPAPVRPAASPVVSPPPAAADPVRTMPPARPPVSGSGQEPPARGGTGHASGDGQAG